MLLEAGGYHTPLKVVRRHQHGHMTYPTGLCASLAVICLKQFRRMPPCNSGMIGIYEEPDIIFIYMAGGPPGVIILVLDYCTGIRGAPAKHHTKNSSNTRVYRHVVHSFIPRPSTYALPSSKNQDTE